METKPMTIEDLEQLLGITIVGTPQEGMYKKRLAVAIAHVNGQCGYRWTDETGAVILPEDVQLGVALVVKGMAENHNVASQSLGDMSKSFFQGATYNAAQSYWKRYRRAGFV